MKIRIIYLSLFLSATNLFAGWWATNEQGVVVGRANQPSAPGHDWLEVPSDIYSRAPEEDFSLLEYGLSYSNGQWYAADRTTVTNTVDRCADPVFAERYAAAWDLAATAQAYGATNATKGANIYLMASVASAATNADQRAAIQSDADRMNAIEEWLSRYGGWENFLQRYETNVTTRTEWRPAE